MVFLTKEFFIHLFDVLTPEEYIYKLNGSGIDSHSMQTQVGGVVVQK